MLNKKPFSVLLSAVCFWIMIPCLEANEDEVTLKIKARLNKNVSVIEVFSTNIRENSITAQFQLSDGMSCCLVYDFANGIKIFKIDVLGETELGQKQYQSMCFVTKLNSTDIIPSEAMAKLRQKTSGTVQEANGIIKSEIIKADTELMNLNLVPEVFRGKFHKMCAEQESIVYAREAELHSLVKGDHQMLSILRSGAHRRSPEDSLSNCSPLSGKFQPCICRVPFTVPWYPCLVKYCQSKNSLGNPITTRCGIKSCRKTFHLYFVASHPLSCHWGVT